jgi:pimeloyl-ACP methyl ester carboxylesterase
VGFTPEEFHYAFCNTLSAEESRKVYDRLHIPAPGSWVWSSVLGNLTPGRHPTWVDYANHDRAPLLFIAGGADHIMPASVNRSNAKHYAKSRALTQIVVFPERSHFTGGEPGWEKVADEALAWAEGNTTRLRRSA